MERFMNNIKSYRIKLGESQAELGKVIGVSSASIGFWERGQRSPRDNHRLALMKHFNATFDDIFFTTNTTI